MRLSSLFAVKSVWPFLLRLVLLAVIVLIGPSFGRFLIPAHTAVVIPALVIVALLAFFTVPGFLRKEKNYISFLLGFLATVLTPASVKSEKFYELTATIVPVLFLALAVDTRAFRLGSMQNRPRVLSEIFVAVPAVGLAVAGFESFRVIVIGEATRGRFDIVVGALVAASTSLLISSLVDWIPSTDGSASNPLINEQSQEGGSD